jgi:hypothetical protein
MGSGVMLFGGFGLDAAGTRSNLDDLWRWDGSQWTWLGGHSQADQRGVYGTRGTPAATSWPGARDTAAFALASGGSAWLYGGVGCDSATCDTVSNFLGDLWRWDGAQWTWLSGSNVADERPVHGTRGTPGASNRPGSRKGSGGAVDPSGAFWVFGGRGYDSAGTVSRLGDLWRYR